MDTELVERARRGDHASFEAIFVAVADRLLGIAYGILRDREAAEDAVQQTVVAAWRDLPGLRDATRFDGWIRRILVRSCYATRRETRREVAALRLLSFPESGADLLHGMVTRETLDRAFRHLPMEQRVVLVHRFFLDLPVDQIAEDLGIPAGTVKSRLHYGVAAMRAAIEADARDSDREALA